MNRIALQQYCLKMMGIIQWKQREKAPKVSYNYLLWLKSGEISQTKQQLIERILQALNWPLEESKVIELFKDPKEGFKQFLQTIEDYQPKKGLIFGMDFRQKLQGESSHCQMAFLPSVDEILSDPLLKRKAWEEMKKVYQM